MNKDFTLLKSLAHLHFVVASIPAFLSSCFASVLIPRIFELARNSSEQYPSELTVTILVATIYFLPGWVYAIFLIVLGIFLEKSKNHTQCIIIATISCIFIPIGTALGMYTIGILNRPTIKELFDSRISIAHV